MSHMPKIGSDEKVNVWIYHTKKWERRYPVDAREIVAMQQGDFAGPNITMKGPAGSLNVAQNEVDHYLGQGYTIVEGQTVPTIPTDPLIRTVTNSPLNDLSVIELRQLAGEHGASDVGGMSRSELVAWLHQKGVEPPKAGENDTNGEDGKNGGENGDGGDGGTKTTPTSVRTTRRTR